MLLSLSTSGQSKSVVWIADYNRSSSRNSHVKSRDELTADAIATLFARADHTGVTAALFYAKVQNTICLWAFGHGKLLGSAALSRSSVVNLLPVLWANLDVSAGTRRAFKPSRTGTDEECRRPWEGEAGASSDRNSVLSKSDSVYKKALEPIKAVLLPASISELLARDKKFVRLAILPTDEIAEFPFAALPWDGKFLIDTYAIVLLPGLSYANNGSIARNTRGGYNMSQFTDATEASERRIAWNPGAASLVVGNPTLTASDGYCWRPLRYARQEAINAGKILGTAPLVDVQANIFEVTQQLRDKSDVLIYFATHGVASNKIPNRGSFLALAKGNLSVEMIWGFSLVKHPLVVMSACETGLGPVHEELGGIQNIGSAWFAAGASQVVMSLWDVDDRGAMRLMSRFIAELARNGAQTSHCAFGFGAEFALALAMRETKTQDRNPALWAAFTVFGNLTSITSGDP